MGSVTFAVEEADALAPLAAGALCSMGAGAGASAGAAAAATAAWAGVAVLLGASTAERYRSGAVAPGAALF